jgi:hypothetical protein
MTQMQNIQMKIVDWDEETMSLIVKYSSDINSTSIDDSAALAIQPLTMFTHDQDDSATVLKRMAKTGVDYCTTLARAESARLDTAKIDFFRNLKGQTLTFEISDLEAPEGWDDEFYSGDPLQQTDSNINPQSL